MTFKNAEQVIAYMVNKSGKSGMFSLDPMLAICHAHDQFQLQFPTLHVAGTNGKGSTSHFLASIFQSQGYKVGLFTSPFFMNHRDRIRINDEWIPEARLVELANRYYPDFEKYGLSFFEIDTFIALRYFYEEHVDIAVIEVGLGGRLDATNVIVPLVSAITNIGWDHMDYLGDTLGKIAFEKAGIIKPGVPVAIGANMVDEADQVIRTVALERNSELTKTPYPEHIVQGDHIHFMWKGHDFEIATPVHYQPLNAALALQVVELVNQQGGTLQVSDASIRAGLLRSIWKGRFEIIHRNPTWIIDGAHNAHGMKAMLDALQYYRQPHQKVHILFAALRDKPVTEMLEMLLQVSDDVTLTSFNHYRQLNLETYTPPVGTKTTIYYQDFLDHWMQASTNDDIYLITGSLYFLTEVVHYLQLKGWIPQ